MLEHWGIFFSVFFFFWFIGRQTLFTLCWVECLKASLVLTAWCLKTQNNTCLNNWSRNCLLFSFVLTFALNLGNILYSRTWRMLGPKGFVIYSFFFKIFMYFLCWPLHSYEGQRKPYGVNSFLGMDPKDWISATWLWSTRLTLLSRLVVPFLFIWKQSYWPTRITH